MYWSTRITLRCNDIGTNPVNGLHQQGENTVLMVTVLLVMIPKFLAIIRLTTKREKYSSYLDICPPKILLNLLLLLTIIYFTPPIATVVST